MINRVQYLTGAAPEEFVYTDYFEIEALGDTYIVALSTAFAVERQLEASSINTWIEFRDVFNARHRVPARFIYRITENTAETRAVVRSISASATEGSSR